MPSSPEKKQGLSQNTRRVILWAVMIVVAAGLLFWWVRSFKEKFSNIGGEELQKEINLPFLKEQLKELP